MYFSTTSYLHQVTKILLNQNLKMWLKCSHTVNSPAPGRAILRKLDCNTQLYCLCDRGHLDHVHQAKSKKWVFKVKGFT